MRRDVLGGTSLVIGALSGLVTMAFHPTHHDVAAGQAARSLAVHGLALAGVPLTLYGAFVLTRRIASRDALAELALAYFGAAAVAVMLAATSSGFIASGLLSEMGQWAGTERVVGEAMLHSTWQWNQAFARIHVAASSVAIGLWSVAILRGGELSRRAAIYGLIVAALTLLALLTGQLRMDLHGFGAVVVAQAVWLIVLGLELRRPPGGPSPTDLPSPGYGL